LLLPCAPQLLLDVTEQAGFLCEQVAVLGAAINERNINEDRLFFFFVKELSTSDILEGGNE
jgi:hypothetical protein